jgi:hypothetical protein
VAVDLGLDLLRVLDGEKRQARCRLRELAAVADLTARLRVERRLAQDDDAALALPRASGPAIRRDTAP